MDIVALWFEDSENQEQNIQRRRLGDNNIMELSESSFVQNFRLSKEAFLYTMEVIKNNLPSVERRTSVQPILKLASTLKFLAQGNYQHQIGQDRLCIMETCKAVEDILCLRHISFMLSQESRNQTK